LTPYLVSAKLPAMAGAGASTTRLSKEERREAILDAAMEEFAVGGMDGTPVEAIAKRVGVSQPYLFQLFGTKKELYIASVRRGFDRVLGTFRRAAAGAGEDADGVTVLKEIGSSYQPLLQDRTFLRLQLQAYAACDDIDVRDAVREEYARLYRFVASATGAPDWALHAFFAEGMMMNVAAAMDLEHLDEDWARNVASGKEDWMAHLQELQ
jgi:AcrR family transcriptional regulator